MPDSRSDDAKGRLDARTELTRARIILAAEKLFVTHGWNAVSFREISRAFGMKNSSIVQYHFGDRDNLIEEIAAFRVGEMEIRRRELLDEIEILSSTEAGISRILYCLFEPILDAKADGIHIYAQFLLSYLLHKRAFMLDIENVSDRRHPNDQLSRAHHLLIEALPHLSRQDVIRRLVMVSLMILGNVAMYDSGEAQIWGRGKEPLDQNLINEAALFMMQPATVGQL